MDGWPYFTSIRTLEKIRESLRQAPPHGDIEEWLRSTVGLSPSVARQDAQTLRRLELVDKGDLSRLSQALADDAVSDTARRILERHYAELYDAYRKNGSTMGELVRFIEERSGVGPVTAGRVARTFLEFVRLAHGRLTRANARDNARRAVGSRTAEPNRLLHTLTVPTVSTQMIRLRSSEGEEMTISVPARLRRSDVERLRRALDLLYVVDDEQVNDRGSE